MKDLKQKAKNLIEKEIEKRAKIAAKYGLMLNSEEHKVAFFVECLKGNTGLWYILFETFDEDKAIAKFREACKTEESVKLCWACQQGCSLGVIYDEVAFGGKNKHTSTKEYYI